MPPLKGSRKRRLDFQEDLLHSITPPSTHAEPTADFVLVLPPTVTTNITPTSDQTAASSPASETSIVAHSSAVKKKTRGIITMRETAELVRKNNHTRFDVTWDPENVDVATTRGSQQFVYDIGACVRSLVPLTKATFSEHDIGVEKRVYESLACFYNIDVKCDELMKFIHNKCNLAYGNYKHKLFEKYKKDRFVMPLMFKERLDEWEFLVAYWESDEFKKKSVYMSGIRAEKKINHTAGAKSINTRANEYKEKQTSHFPHLQAHYDVYKDKGKNQAEAVLLGATAELEAFKASQPDIVASQPNFILPIDIQASVLGGVVGVCRGTTVRGMGGAPIKAPLKRGPAKGSTRDADANSLKINELEETIVEVKRQREEDKKKYEEDLEMFRRQREEDNKRLEERFARLQSGGSLH